jgi:hypothetical protein
VGRYEPTDRGWFSALAPMVSHRRSRNVAVQVGALSYVGQLNFDIVADANLVPDLTVFANGMIEDLERLGAGSHERE